MGKHYIKARVDRFKLGEVLNGRSINMVVATHLIDVPNCAWLLKFLGKHYIKARVDRFKLGEVLNGRSIKMVVATHLIDVPI